MISGYLLLSKATHKLEAGMWGGAINRPDSVARVRKELPRLSVGSSERRRRAARRIREAALECEFPVYVVDKKVLGPSRGAIYPGFRLHFCFGKRHHSFGP